MKRWTWMLAAALVPVGVLLLKPVAAAPDLPPAAQPAELQLPQGGAPIQGLPAERPTPERVPREPAVVAELVRTAEQSAPRPTVERRAAARKLEEVGRLYRAVPDLTESQQERLGQALDWLDRERLRVAGEFVSLERLREQTRSVEAEFDQRLSLFLSPRQREAVQAARALIRDENVREMENTPP